MTERLKNYMLNNINQPITNLEKTDKNNKTIR